MLTAKEENGKLVVSADAEMFIVPNLPCRVDEFFYGQEDTVEYMNEVAKLNGFEYSRDDLLYEIWFVSSDLESENMRDHMYKVNTEDHVYTGRLRSTYLPYELIKRWKEGETHDLVLPDTLAVYTKDESGIIMQKENVEAELHLNMTAVQGKYRYRSYGTFENALQRGR